MPSVFTRIIEGELPARFVWRDESVVAFLSANPVTAGHTLVVPRVEVDHWLDLEEHLWRHCAEVSRQVGIAIQQAFQPPRVGQAIAGFEVPHVHVHVLPMHDMSDLSLTNAASDPDATEMDEAAARIRSALTGAGHGDRVAEGR